MARSRGAPPPRLTGGRRVRPDVTPWWDSVRERILSDPSLVGRTMTIEEITATVAAYPNGRRVRSRSVARRLRGILELIERGPNGSRGRGATYRIVAPQSPTASTTDPVEIRTDVEDVVIGSDRQWLLEQVERMTGGKP